LNIDCFSVARRLSSLGLPSHIDTLQHLLLEEKAKNRRLEVKLKAAKQQLKESEARNVRKTKQKNS